MQDWPIRTYHRPPSRLWNNVITRFVISLTAIYVVLGVVVGIVEGWK